MLISTHIRKELEREGYHVEIKNVMKAAFHCYIRFPGLSFREGLSGHKEQRILIQLDAEPQRYKYKPENVILNKFDVFAEISATPLPVLLSQKLFAILNRRQPKGRDFFDVVFLLAKTLPDYQYLKQKKGIKDADELRHAIAHRCAGIDMKMMADDVRQFLFHPGETKKILLFPKYFENARL